MPRPDITFDAPGLSVAADTLNGLAQEYGPRNALRAFTTPTRNSLKSAERLIRETTPVDEGELAQSTQIRVGVPTRSIRRSRYFLRDGHTVFVGRVGWFWNSAQGSQWGKALAIEFGTSRQTPRRVIRDALEQTNQEIIAVFSQEISKSVVRRARQLARQAEAGTLRRR